MSTKAKGTRKEYAVRDLKRAEGWYAFRTRDDQSVCDVVAMRYRDALSTYPDRHGHSDSLRLAEVQMIEVKCNVEGGPYMNFRKADREALRAAARLAGAQAILCYWPARKEPRWIPEAEWPT